MEVFRILDPDPYNNSIGSASLHRSSRRDRWCLLSQSRPIPVAWVSVMGTQEQSERPLVPSITEVTYTCSMGVCEGYAGVVGGTAGAVYHRVNLYL